MEIGDGAGLPYLPELVSAQLLVFLLFLVASVVVCVCFVCFSCILYSYNY